MLLLLLPIAVVTLATTFLESSIFFRLTEVPELLVSYNSSDTLCETVCLKNNNGVMSMEDWQIYLSMM